MSIDPGDVPEGASFETEQVRGAAELIMKEAENTNDRRIALALTMLAHRIDQLNKEA